MPLRSKVPLRLLASALRGEGSPLGPARRIEFIPPLPGGHAYGTLVDTDSAVLDQMELPSSRARMNAAAAITWTLPKGAGSGVITLGDLSGITYEGEGVWRLKSKRRFRLLADSHIFPSQLQDGPRALLQALRGDSTQSAGAHSLVLVDEHGQYEAICEVRLFVEPALELALDHADEPAIQQYINGKQANTPVISCVNPLTDTVINFSLPVLLTATVDEDGVFTFSNGTRIGVIGLRSVKPELHQAAPHGFVLPRLEFRPPSTILH